VKAPPLTETTAIEMAMHGAHHLRPAKPQKQTGMPLQRRPRFNRWSSATALAHGRDIERSFGERSQQFGLWLGQVKASNPVLGLSSHDLPVVIRSDVRAGRSRQHRKGRRVVPCASLHSPAIAVIGDPFRANRCFAFGNFLPVNSKKAEAGMRQRLLLAKCRPSDRKLKTGALPAAGNA
jgi:hypothetical protein